MAKRLVVVTISWPVTQGLPLALYKLAEGTVSTDPLVATLFFSQGASPHSHFHTSPRCQHNKYAENYEYEKNSFFHSFSPPHGDLGRKEGFPRKEGQMRAELFHRKKLTVHADFPLKDIACVLLAQTKDAKIVCVIGCQITRTRIHTLLKHLASARHDNREKTVHLPDCTLQTNQSVKTKEVDDVFSRRPLYCGHTGSDVIGCRRPKGGVFIYVCFRHGSR